MLREMSGEKVFQKLLIKILDQYYDRIPFKDNLLKQRTSFQTLEKLTSVQFTCAIKVSAGNIVEQNTEKQATEELV